MNKLLNRQIAKHFGNPADVPAELRKLLEAISDTYDHHEKGRKLLEHTIELSSKEMTELNDQLRKENEENARAIFHLSTSQKIAHIGSWELDLADMEESGAKLVYCSAETYRIFGLERDSEISSGLFYSLVHPDDVAIVRSAFTTAFHTGTLEVQHRLLLPDGTEKTVHERGEIIKDEKTGKPLKCLGTMQDITGVTLAEKELQKANRELKTLFDNMQEVFYSIDLPNYTLLQMSPACEKVYGYTVEEFEKNSNLWFDLILEEDRYVIGNNTPILQAGKPIVNVYRIRHKSGAIRWMESKLTPTLDAEGNLLRLDGFTSDITQRKEAEDALTKSEHKFRALIENSTDAIMVVDENSVVSYASNSLFRIMEQTPEEVLGVSSTNFIHPGDLEALGRNMQKVLDNPRLPCDITYRRIRKDGSIIWCDGTATNFLDDEEIKGIVINFRDVTERKNYEEALEASNEELKKSNGELDRFVYSVSHDLRAPLSSILGIVELMEYDCTDDGMRNDLQLVKGSVKKLDGFIADILHYSRNSRLEVKKEQINFEELLQDVVGQLRFMTSESKDISFQFEIMDEAPFYSDRSRIIIILNNLVSNAIRYSDMAKPNPYVDITVHTYKDKAIILVKDNGIGIDEKQQDRVFDIFYRVSKKSTGSGLGLYILKEAVQKLHGSISLCSQPGVGSEFSIQLPNSKP